MKKLLLSICAILALGLPFVLSSCSSDKVEHTISDMGYGDWDINGDGEAGREINFKGSPTRKGHCYDCGLNHYGSYVCPSFEPKASSPTTCDNCGCPMGRHALN